MQKEEPRDQQGPDTPRTGEAIRFLEDPHRLVVGPEHGQVTVYVHGVVTAILSGHTNSLVLQNAEPVFIATVMDFDRLFWSQQGALLRLQGEQVYNLLGSAITLIRGKHLPVWHPRPGIEDVRAVVPILNPRGLAPVDVFQLAIQLGY